jgi:Flp pilus assembly pilin Flp
MLKLAKKFWNDEQGLELSEYAVMAGIIVVALITIIGLLSGAIQTAFTRVTGAINAGN